MSKWANADLSEYDAEDPQTDQQRIEAGHAVPNLRSCLQTITADNPILQ